ncbi:MAG TPA: type II toxin-antitoxin system prevent-host-death family antitoxin [Tetrasphaera sp.]|nr:type II toxin-antitoxin system prevent-host-death family antitoxin [Tetrasphaera sp.]
MTASEASRNFSAVLDAAEEGETIVVTRAGRRVATIAPAPTVNAPELRAVFSRWQGDPAFDDGLEGRIEAARSSVLADLDNDPWLD